MTTTRKISEIATRVTALEATDRFEVSQEVGTTPVTKYATPEDIAAYGPIKRITVTGIQYEDVFDIFPSFLEIVPAAPASHVHNVVRATFYIAPDVSVGGGEGLPETQNLKLYYSELPLPAEIDAEEPKYAFNLDVDFRQMDTGGLLSARQGDDARLWRADENGGDSILFLPTVVAAPLKLGASPSSYKRNISDNPADVTIVSGGTSYLSSGTTEARYTGTDGRDSFFNFEYTATGGVIDGITAVNDRAIWFDHINEEFIVDDNGGDSAVVIPTNLAAFTNPSFGDAGATLVVDYVTHDLTGGV
jgi:hypothetical protein